MRDLHNNIKVSKGIAPYDHATGDAAVSTEIIDTQGYGSLEFLIATGSLADDDATFTVLVQHGDDSALGDAASVDDVDLLGTEAGASFVFSDDNSVFKIGYTGDKRYVRLTITPDGNTGAALLCVVVVQGHPDNTPVE
ncbi:MAG: hypothetical protein M0P69_13000 [Bacteroidales bacterium]|nr:hypothetical protein [Bacteroidales bacterium]